MRVFTVRSRSARRLISAAIAAFVCAPGLAASPSVAPVFSTTIHPDIWPTVPRALPASPVLEARIKSLLASMSVEDKVGQLIQADISAITPEDLKTYRLGSVLANSLPLGPLLPPASTEPSR